MDQSNTMKFVMARAKAEAKHGGRSDISVEDLFLGILKISEIRAEDFLDGPEIYLKVINIEIHALKILFTDVYKTDTTRLRGLLRTELIHRKITEPEKPEGYIKRAEKIAKERNSLQLFPCDMLQAIVENPTAILKQVCDITDWTKPKEEAERKSSAEASGKAGNGMQPDGEEIPYTGKEGGGSEVDEMSPEFLTELTSRVRRLRAKLLSTVQGQDHVVHAFADGIFAAEVLAAGDENRKRPRAIFAFAGPPGVGKTFLAEQAAEALDLPYKRFDMSTYADHMSGLALVGSEPIYHGACPGELTGFVHDHPKCILLFDEIEKAHQNVVHLFLQLLDAGRLEDRYTKQTVDFRDTIVIFTSNAGRSLYEGDGRQSAAGIPRKVILHALESEIDQRTGQPFFPAAITSRLATGWPILFNHLAPHDLEKISGKEISRFEELFKKQYSVNVSADDLLPVALLFHEGGKVDARTLRAQTELFFKSEIFKLCRLWSEDSLEETLKGISSIDFTVETDSLTEETRPLFFSDEKAEILIFGDPAFAERCRRELPGYVFYDTRNAEEALSIAGEKDIRLVLLDITEQSRTGEERTDTGLEEVGRSDLMLSVGAFEYKPMAAGAFRKGRGLFRTLRERLPELPVYLLETKELAIDDELIMSFVRAGARGKLTEPEEEFSVFEDMLSQVCRELYLQGIAARLAAERKTLSFETAPKLSENKSEVTIRLRDFTLKRATESEDADDMLDDAEKPDTRFTDVIGATDAKDELKFFVDYLKNPKKFMAQGLKPPKGVLLYGPPGTGKTMLARAMAGESDVAFIPTNASTFVKQFTGTGPAAVRELFHRARKYAPSVIFIDEIDAIGRKRQGTLYAQAEEITLNALLTEMDGFNVDPKRPVFVLAATNYAVEEGGRGIGALDPALVRRFDRKILVDLPDEAAREELLKVLLSKNPTQQVSDDMVQRLASRSVGMSPANLTFVVEAANRMAVKSGKPVDDEILEEAFELTKHGEKKNWGYEYLERVARHECGHAYMSFLGGNTPAYLTIVARGDHGGYMEHSAKETVPLSTKEELLSRIRTGLGGRAAEILYYGGKDGISTGAAGDLENATKLAAAMLSAYGMDDEFGLVYMDPKDAMKDPEFRRRVNEILRGEMQKTIELLRENRESMDRLVGELMKRNKLTGEEIEEILRAVPAE